MNCSTKPQEFQLRLVLLDLLPSPPSSSLVADARSLENNLSRVSSWASLYKQLTGFGHRTLQMQYYRGYSRRHGHHMNR